MRSLSVEVGNAYFNYEACAPRGPPFGFVFNRTARASYETLLHHMKWAGQHPDSVILEAPQPFGPIVSEAHGLGSSEGRNPVDAFVRLMCLVIDL